MSAAITFGTIRNFCSQIDRVSICMKETLDYENYMFISDVPHSYDDCYLYGFGIIESEFCDGDTDHYCYKTCLEIMLSEKPREDM